MHCVFFLIILPYARAVVLFFALYVLDLEEERVLMWIILLLTPSLFYCLVFLVIKKENLV